MEPQRRVHRALPFEPSGDAADDLLGDREVVCTAHRLLSIDSRRDAHLLCQALPVSLNARFPVNLHLDLVDDARVEL